MQVKATRSCDNWSFTCVGWGGTMEIEAVLCIHLSGSCNLLRPFASLHHLTLSFEIKFTRGIGEGAGGWKSKISYKKSFQDSPWSQFRAISKNQSVKSRHTFYLRHLQGLRIQKIIRFRQFTAELQETPKSSRSTKRRRAIRHHKTNKKNFSFQCFATVKTQKGFKLTRKSCGRVENKKV